MIGIQIVIASTQSCEAMSFSAAKPDVSLSALSDFSAALQYYSQ
jgi:hypothetical protein